MGTTKTWTIGAHTVCAAMASAVRQDELLSLIAQPIFQSFAIAAQGGVEVNTKQIALRLMTFKPEEKARIVDILTERAFLIVGGQNSEVRVSARDYQGHMVQWNTLLAELLTWNLADFFEQLSSDLKPLSAAEKAEESQQPSTGT